MYVCMSIKKIPAVPDTVVVAPDECVLDSQGGGASTTGWLNSVIN